MQGYLHPDYARSLSEFGSPRKLPRSNGWILERKIPGFNERDAIGTYPLFFCGNWSLLQSDLDEIRDLVSLVVVPDPFSAPDPEVMRQCFRDLVQPFKEHSVIDLGSCGTDMVSAHHRKYAWKGLKRLKVEIAPDPGAFLEEWIQIYGNLTRRKKITGIRSFSRRSFEIQLSIPGVLMFRALPLESQISVATLLVYVQGKTAYGHLIASTPSGYRLHASYALFWSAIKYLAGKARWLDIGGNAGLSNDVSDHLNQFKRGWTALTRETYLCGCIFRPDLYREISRTRGISSSIYFPAYRSGEF